MHQPNRGKPRMIVATACLTACGLLVPAAQASTSSQASTAGSATVTTAAAAAAPGNMTSRVRGTFGRAGTVRGTFTPKRFIVQSGDAYGVGVLHATLRRANGSLVGTVNRQVTLPIRNATNPSQRVAALATCDILHLVLGPLNLDLLGLQVHLNRVVLDIVAATGAGRLLGNLLCAVTGLLDGTGALSAFRLSNALNRILSILRV